jgi:hypothetical protein
VIPHNRPADQDGIDSNPDGNRYDTIAGRDTGGYVDLHTVNVDPVGLAMLFPVSVEVDEKAGGGDFTTQRILILISKCPRKRPWPIKMRCGIMALSGEVRRSLRGGRSLACLLPHAES